MKKYLVLFFIIPASVFCQTPATDPSWELLYNEDFNSPIEDNPDWVVKDNHDHYGEYSAHLADNVSVQSGKLYLELNNNHYTSPAAYLDFQHLNHTSYDYTSAMVLSDINFQYGYIEASISFPYGDNFWPAFWTIQGQNITSVCPPNLGANEIDIIENNGDEPANEVGTNMHIGYCNDCEGCKIHEFYIDAMTKTSSHPLYGSGSSMGYTVNGIEGATINLVPGEKYKFIVTHHQYSHPFYLTTDPHGGAGTQAGIYLSGVSYPGFTSTAVSTIYFTTSSNTPSTLYYMNDDFPDMGGPINVSACPPFGGCMKECTNNDYDKRCDGLPSCFGSRVASPNYADVFHRYAIEWNPDRVIWYIDDNVIRNSENPGIWDPVRLVFNTAILGNASSGPFPDNLIIDYVKAYKLKSDCNTIINSCNYNLVNYDNKLKKEISIGGNGCVNGVLPGSNTWMRASNFVSLSGDFDVPVGATFYADVSHECDNQVLDYACSYILSSCNYDFAGYSNDVRRNIKLGGAGCYAIINSNHHILLDAEESITLLPGFQCESGSVSEIKIVPCQ